MKGGAGGGEVVRVGGEDEHGRGGVLEIIPWLPP